MIPHVIVLEPGLVMENAFGFYLAGMVGHNFFKPYAVTFDFENMKIFLQWKL